MSNSSFFSKKCSEPFLRRVKVSLPGIHKPEILWVIVWSSSILACLCLAAKEEDRKGWEIWNPEHKRCPHWSPQEPPHEQVML